MKLIFDNPWYVIVLCAAASFAACLALYYRNRKNTEAPKAVLLTLFVLRFSALFFICLLLAGIMLRQLLNETEYPKILLAIDNSSSMVQGSDSQLVKNDLIANIKSLADEVRDKYDVSLLHFGSDLSAGAPANSFTAKETDIDQLLKGVANNYANQNIGALVIFSDGIYNSGGNPAYSLEQLRFPVHTMAFGDTAEKADLFIKKVDHNQVAYQGNNFPVQVNIAGKKMSGTKITVELLQGPTLKASREVLLGSDQFSDQLTFTLTAGKPGLQKYAARVRSDVGETNKLNNSQEFIVEVIDNKEKILLMATAPHPDIAAIRETVLNNTAYELDLAFTGKAEPVWQSYNLVIIHGYSAAQARKIEICREKQIPFWIINPSTTEGLPGVRITGSMNRYNEAESYPDKSFGLFTLSDALRDFIPGLPAVKTFFGNYSLAGGASALVNQRLGSVETEQPILYFISSSDLKSAVFLGEGLWRWKFRDFSAHQNNNLFSELISKSIQYLAVKNDKSFFRIQAPKIVTENEEIELDAELYNKSYEPVNNPDVFITLTREDNKKFNYTFSKTEKGYHLNIGSLPAGEYKYSATVTLAGETFGKEGRIAVRAMVAENLNTVANHDILQQMSTRSGGNFYKASQFEALARDLSQEGSMKAVVYTQTLTRPLIDEKMFFFLILLLLAFEWFFRKRYLLI